MSEPNDTAPEELNFIFPPPDQELDRFLGALIVILLAVGLVGNISALLYFRFNQHKSLPDKLYIAIITVDIITNIVSVSTATFLFSKRYTILCYTSYIQLVLAVMGRFSAKMSCFLVAVLSIIRSFAIIKPHKAKQVRPSLVAKVIVGYALFIILMTAVPLGLGWTEPSRLPRSCPAIVSKPQTHTVAVAFIRISDQFELISTSVAVFTSFTLSTVFLKKKKVNPSSNLDTESRSRKVSVTIAIFAALFLFCNLPCFSISTFLILYQNVKSVKQTVDEYVIEDKPIWIFWYDELIFMHVPVQLNAALNPCLYFMRMPRFREQLLQWFTTVRKKLANFFNFSGVVLAI